MNADFVLTRDEAEALTAWLDSMAADLEAGSGSASDALTELTTALERALDQDGEFSFTITIEAEPEA